MKRDAKAVFGLKLLAYKNFRGLKTLYEYLYHLQMSQCSFCSIEVTYRFNHDEKTIYHNLQLLK